MYINRDILQIMMTPWSAWSVGDSVVLPFCFVFSFLPEVKKPKMVCYVTEVCLWWRMALTETLTHLVLVVFKRLFFFRILSANSRRKKPLAMSIARKHVLYTVEKVESNGIFDWFREKSTRFVENSLAPQVSNLQSIDRFFLAKKEF